MTSKRSCSKPINPWGAPITILTMFRLRCHKQPWQLQVARERLPRNQVLVRIVGPSDPSSKQAAHKRSNSLIDGMRIAHLKIGSSSTKGNRDIMACALLCSMRGIPRTIPLNAGVALSDWTHWVITALVWWIHRMQMTKIQIVDYDYTA